MNYLKPIFAVVCLLASLNAHTQSAESESDLFRLLSPSPQELLSEFGFREIHTYRGLSDSVIEQALDEQFYRIQFFSFSSTTEEEDCQ